MIALTENPCDVDAWICNRVYDSTSNHGLAQAADWFVAKPLSILGLVVAGVIANWIIRRIIGRTLGRAAKVDPTKLTPSRYGASKAASLRTARHGARTETLASVLKSTTSFVIFSVIAVMIVSELGYNVAPLIAGAGILGLALSLGAQSVIRDFISGFFMFIEDQLGVGDAVTINDVAGTVEELNLRTTKVIAEDGTVWYIRNGDVSKVGNRTQSQEG